MHHGEQGFVLIGLNKCRGKSFDISDSLARPLVPDTVPQGCSVSLFILPKLT